MGGGERRVGEQATQSDWHFSPEIEVKPEIESEVNLRYDLSLYRRHSEVKPEIWNEVTHFNFTPLGDPEILNEARIWNEVSHFNFTLSPTLWNRNLKWTLKWTPPDVEIWNQTLHFRIWNRSPKSKSSLKSRAVNASLLHHSGIRSASTNHDSYNNWEHESQHV